MNKGIAASPIEALLADKEEDRFTEFLAHLLQDEFVLRVFLEKVCPPLSPDPLREPLRVSTQVTVPDGRPDLCIEGATSQLVFEVKVGSWLHDDQIGPYARAMMAWKAAHPQGLAQLLLIVPRAVADAEGVRAEEQARSAAPQLPKPQVVMWEQIADVFALQADAASPRTKVYLHDFSQLIRKRLGDGLREISAEEARLGQDALIGSFIELAFQYAGEVANSIAAKGFKLSRTGGKNQLYAGWSITTPEGLPRFWLGVWPYAWSKVGGSPVFLQDFLRRPSDLKLRTGLPSWSQLSTSQGESIVVPLRLTPGVAPQNLVAEMVATFDRWVGAT